MSCDSCGTLRLETDAACGYHATGSHEFETSKLGPKGLPVEMYYAMYPLAFAAVYGARLDGGQVRVGAPRDPSTGFVLKERPVSWLVAFKNLVKDLLRAVRPWAKEVCNVDMVPEQAAAGGASDSGYRFNLDGRFDYLCPAAFSSIYPHLFYELENGVRSERNRIVGCPDHRINQQFQFLSDGPEDELDSCGCYDFSDLGLRIENGGGKTEEVPVMDLMAASGVKCFTAYQVMAPYVLTLLRGGNLTFYTDDEHSAVAQCPSVKNRVQFRIARDPEDGKVTHEVIAVEGTCPRGYRTGDRAQVAELPALSPYHLYLAYLYAVYLLRADPGLKISFRDPLASPGRLFELGRGNRRKLHVAKSPEAGTHRAAGA